MAALNPNERLQEAFSLALEDRSRGYQDLVSDNNAILYLMKKKGQFKTFSGPTIRERLLYAESGTYVRYSGYQFLNPKPAQLFNDAEYTPKLAAVSVTLSGEDVLQNSGRNQLMNIMEGHIEAAEQELLDRFTEDLHGDGTLENQIGGLALAIPRVPDQGTYGGIDRAANPIWQTSSVTKTTDFITSSTVKDVFDDIVIAQQRGRDSADCIISSAPHYKAYLQSLETIQRINDENELGKQGFANIMYYGAGFSMPVVLEGGIRSYMPANTSYFVASKYMRFRYHPSRNFEKFGGKQMPVNQDAYVQHIGFYGNLTMYNPLFMTNLFDG